MRTKGKFMTIKKIGISIGGGPGLAGFLFVAFLCMKLGVGDTEAVNWSWWWVTAPLWIPVGIILGIITGIAGLYLIAIALGKGR
jgi:hypothetical protein